MAGKTSGADLVDGLDGSDHAKRWARAVLKTVSGNDTVVDAAKRMDCNEAYFYKNRGRALQAMLEALEPRTPGRKPTAPDPRAERIQQLEGELLRAKGALEAASARVTIALGGVSTRRPKGRRRAPPSS